MIRYSVFAKLLTLTNFSYRAKNGKYALQFNQSSECFQKNVSRRVFQKYFGQNLAQIAHCTWDTPSSDYQHVLQICSDHNSGETSHHKVDTSCEDQCYKIKNAYQINEELLCNYF